MFVFINVAQSSIQGSSRRSGRSEIIEPPLEEEGAFDFQPEDFELGEDIYSLLFVSPIGGTAFFFSSYMILLKLALFTFLALDLQAQSSGDFAVDQNLIRITQFFMLPVAIALQEDLIHVYTRIANIRYDPQILEKSPYAVEWKFALSFLLRFIDGLYSLIINFVLLLTSKEVLSLFLNFAALGFLQSIDDVAFGLAADGYLGDKMEDKCNLVKQCTLPRRVGDRFTNALDTILFLTTYAVMLAIYIYVILNDNRYEPEG